MAKGSDATRLQQLTETVLGPLRLYLQKQREGSLPGARAPGLLFGLVCGALIAVALLGPARPLQWAATGLLFWLCLGFCWIHREIHQEKKKLIEGMLDPQKARWLAFAPQLSPGLKLLAHGLLLFSIVLVLRTCAQIGGASLFKPAPSALGMWAMYTVDLILKATLLDIPEIYKLDVTKIKHVGVGGSTLVFATRLIIMALLAGAVLRWRELYKLVERTASMAQHNGELARQRLRLILEHYPAQLHRLCKWVAAPKWRDKPHSRQAMLEVIGGFGEKLPKIRETLERPLQDHEEADIQESALRGLAEFGDGPLERVHQGIMHHTSPSLRRQACETLAAWKTSESLERLLGYAKSHPEEPIRLAAIEALGHSQCQQAAPLLEQLMFSGKMPKAVRFAAKDALLELGPISEDVRQKMQHQLVHSAHADNRRFAGMILEAHQNASSFGVLAQRLRDEEDPHALVYVIQGLANIAYAVFDKKASHQLEGLMHVVKLCEQAEEYGIYGRLMEIIHGQGSIFPKIAAIQALADFLGVWSVKGESGGQAPSARRILRLLHELSGHEDPQIADTAMDTQARLPKALVEEFGQAGERQESYRRDALTCAGVADFHARSLRASRPAMFAEPPEEYGYRDDAVTCVLSLDVNPLSRENPNTQRKVQLGQDFPTLLPPSYDASLAPSPPSSRQFAAPRPPQPSRRWGTRTPLLVEEPLPEGLSSLPHWLRTRYRFVKPVSQGSLATVFRVYDRVERQEKAFKVANHPDPVYQGVVQREIEALRACASPGLLPILEAYPSLETPAFTVPWVQQRTLFEAMVQRKRSGQSWSLEDVEGIVVPLTHVLQEMHKRGWCHGDIKPENIFYTGQEIILYDMDAAREVSASEPADTLSLPIGTPYYMAPEQVHRDAIDPRVDIYALGILTYELLAGSLPLGMEPPPLHELRDDLPGSLDAVLKKATAFKPEDRFPTPEAYKLAFLSTMSPPALAQ